MLWGVARVLPSPPGGVPFLALARFDLETSLRFFFIFTGYIRYYYESLISLMCKNDRGLWAFACVFILSACSIVLGSFLFTQASLYLQYTRKGLQNFDFYGVRASSRYPKHSLIEQVLLQICRAACFHLKP